MKKIIALALSLVFSVAAYANEFMPRSLLWFTNNSPGIIKVYGPGIDFYELILPSKTAHIVLSPISQRLDLKYRILTESGESMEYLRKGYVGECDTRTTQSVYRSVNDRPGTVTMTSDACRMGP